jgi:aubergine-like protein
VTYKNFFDFFIVS